LLRRHAAFNTRHDHGRNGTPAIESRTVDTLEPLVSSDAGHSDAGHFFTVDVEEYFHVSAFEGVVTRDAWPTYPRRLTRSVGQLLELLDGAGARGTFFTLGWVADHEPAVVRQIAAAGHEIASHGYWHRRLTTQTAAEFREDLRASKKALEDACGTVVTGFRAPSFSLVPGREWAFDILVEEGFRYDSSIFPIRRRGYGYPGARRVPHVIRRASGVLAEFPLATAKVFGYPVPAAGGGYLRQFPFGVIRRAFADSTRRGDPATFYVHPWELDPDQPRLPVSPLTRLRHYRGLAVTRERIAQLLEQFRFDAIAPHVEAVLASDSRSAGVYPQ
jgi:polysaccharide deacetylase family protein (PEP-CTERM system associated)